MSLFGLSLNVKGLGDDAAKSALRQYINNQQTKPLFVALQEVKLRGKEMENLGDKIWKGAAFVYSSAIDGVWAARNPNTPGGCGGSCLGIASYAASYMSDCGVLPEGQGAWTILSNYMSIPKFGIINVYAPNKSVDRARLWALLKDTLQANIPWIWCGDFNMTERNEDKAGGEIKCVGGTEALVWNLIKSKFTLTDPFKRTRGALRFTWSNHQAGSHRILKRLDRFYISQELADRCKIEPPKSLIIAGCALSDHAPVSLRLKLDKKEETRTSNFKMNVRLLEEEDFHLRAKEVWLAESKPTQKEEWGSWWQRAIQRVTKFISLFGKEKAADRRTTEARARDSLAVAQLDLQEDPMNHSAQQRVAVAEGVIQRMDQYRADGEAVRNRLKWIPVCDIESKEFFATVKKKRASNRVTKVLSAEGKTIESEDGIRERCAEYFAEIFNSKGESIEKNKATEEILECISKRISEEAKKHLDAPISVEELREAARTMAKGRSPGPDGLPSEFYVASWSWIGNDYHEMISAAIATQQFGGKINHGTVTLLQKPGDQADLSNKRGITLLNTSYKILSKALARRSILVLQAVIDPCQSAFLPERYILDNVMLASELPCWAIQSKQECVMLSIDFAKAYDRVEWSFLIPLLRKFGFGETFVSYVNLLLSNASADVMVKGKVSSSFNISRSVRQGCPFAPFLFLLVGEAMCQLLTSEQQKGKFKGILLPDEQTRQLYNLFADDTGLSIQAEIRAFENLLSSLKKLEAATGLGINWQKSYAVWISWKARPSAWSRFSFVRWLKPKEKASMLGVPFGLKLPSNTMVNFLCDKLEKELRGWSKLLLTKAARVTLVNSILNASLWYFVTVWLRPEKGLKKIQGLIRRFLWSGDTKVCRCPLRWSICILPKKEGGLGVISVATQTEALLAKWVVRAMHPLRANWKIIFKARLAAVRPLKQLGWEETILNLSTEAKVAAPSVCSKLFRNIWKAWKRISKELSQCLPLHWDEISSSSWWWSPKLTISNMVVGEKVRKSKSMSKCGLLRPSDVWDSAQENWMSADQIQLTYDNPLSSRTEWNSITDDICPMVTEAMRRGKDWVRSDDMLSVRVPAPQHEKDLLECQVCLEIHEMEFSELRPKEERIRKKNQWVHIEPQGCRSCGSILIGLVQWEKGEALSLGSIVKNSIIERDLKWLAFNAHTFEVREAQEPQLPEQMVLQRFRVCQMGKWGASPRHKIGYGHIACLTWDPDNFEWTDGRSFFEFSTAKIRKAITPKPAENFFGRERWELESDYRPPWAEIWTEGRKARESLFLWYIQHGIVCTNEWRGGINEDISTSCILCNSGEEENAKHLLYSCSFAKAAWTWAFRLFKAMQPDKDIGYVPTWRNCLLGTALPSHLAHLQRLWSLFRELLCHAIWKQRCIVSYGGKHIGGLAIFLSCFVSLILYGRIEWAKVVRKLPRVSDSQRNHILFQFDRSWGANRLLCQRSGLTVRWRKQFFQQESG